MATLNDLRAAFSELELKAERPVPARLIKRPTARRRRPRPMWVGAAVVLVAIGLTAAFVTALHRTANPAPMRPSNSPHVTASATLNGKPISFSAVARLAAGSRVSLAATLHAPAGVSLSNIYLIVGVHPDDIGFNGAVYPGGNTVLAHDARSYPSKATIATDWLVSAAVGSRQAVAVRFDLFWTGVNGARESARSAAIVINMAIS